MKKLIGLLFLSIGLVSNSISDQVSLAWCPSLDTNVVGYNIYFSAGPIITNWIPAIYSSNNPYVLISDGTNYYRSYTNKITIGNITTTTITGLIEGNVYYFTATAINSEGNESEFSNEAMYVVPIPFTNSVPTEVRNFQLLKMK